MNGSLQPPTDGNGWLDLFERVAASQWPLTTFLLVLLALVSYLTYSLVRHHIQRSKADCEQDIADLIKRHDRTLAGINDRHKLCEWRVMQITKAMMTHIKAQSSGKRVNHGRRETDLLVGNMLEAALKGPQNDAERAEVNAIQV